jgi:hypothetical protein
MISSTEDWLIASSVITEEKMRWAFNGFGSFKTAVEETLVVPLCKILEVTFGYVPKA